MVRSELGAQWAQMGVDALTGFKEWRLSHPKATLAEIEAAADERLGQLRARMISDAAMASAAASWQGCSQGERPRCGQCDQALVSRGSRPRSLQTHGGREVRLERTYGQCPSCGVGLFPPG
jgi:hypothetical protein